VIVESPVVPGFEDELPYACMYVELDEQPLLLLAGNLVDADPYEAVIGRKVQVTFRKDPTDGFELPQFHLIAEEM
jgi:uncharacterized OB-fold protein